MKQFDTVKNNEWVPVEEDLENTIKVVDSLPTASESELGNTYLLNGAMEGYTKTHFYKCLKDDTTGLYYWSDLNVGRYSVGNCKNIKLMIIDDGEYMRVLISWRDPDDVIVGSEKIFWQKTVLVHQVGHMPIDINDGTAILTNTVRDKYAVFGSFSTNINADNRVHYFKLFPVSEDNAITNDDANGRRAGYNYQITADTKPIYTDTTTYKTYYQRSLNETTGLVEYKALSYNTTNFDDDGEGGWNFKTTIAYYEYQTSYITWSSLRELIQDGTAGLYFPVGSILVLPYHGDFGEMSYEVVDFDGVQLADSSKSHSMTLQAKYLYRWWDYDGGVVFDTNEKAGALTEDDTRDVSKIYYKKIAGGTGATVAAFCPTSSLPQGLSAYPPVTVATSVRTYDHDEPTSTSSYTPALYVESIYDNSHYVTGAVATTYGMGKSGSSTAITSSWNHTYGSYQKSSMYECELGYTDLTKATPATDTNYKYGARHPVDDLPFSSTTQVISGGDAECHTIYNAVGNYESGFNYTVTGNSTNYDGKIPVKDTLAPQTLGPWLGLVPYVKTDDTVATTQTTASASTGYANHRQCWCPSMGPRANAYADRFMRVPKLTEGSSSYGNRRVYHNDVKYYVSAAIDRRIVVSSANKYVQYRRLWLRDATEDIKCLVDVIMANDFANFGAESQDADVVRARYCVNTGTGTYSPDITAICSGVGVNGVELPANDPWLKIPVMDDVYLAGKRYFKATYTAVSAGVIAANDCRPFFTKMTGYEGSYPFTYYARTRAPYGTMVTADTYYTRSFTELEEGIDYTVGDLIPMVSSEPYYIKKKIANTFVWTNGQQSGGEYVTLTHDWAGNTVPSDPAATYYGGQADVRHFRVTDIYQAAISIEQQPKDATWTTTAEFEDCNLFYKMPNLERVAYGNHVWAQSNLRMYFNGPFDSSQVYQVTVDTKFWTGRTYYMFSAGSGYKAMTAGSDYVVNGEIINGISQSGTSVGHEVYVKYAGGVPVGYKVDTYNPMKYWTYGVSPVQQYKYNGVSNTWTGVFNDGDNWWVGQPSINNGLVYDRLATMFWSGCVCQGASNNSTKHFTDFVTRSGTGYNTTNVPTDSTSSSSGSWEGQLESSGTSVSVVANKVLPRQSFLHGFLDCMYKRSTDSTYDSTKTYYFRNPYGEYEIQNNSSLVVQNGPFKACLYEYNTNWLNDIADAKEFLDAIQPVVNHNGCYGTTAALDFYPQTGAGTTTLDKVWLMSTVQAGGVASHNSSGVIQSGCMNNGVYENTTTNTFVGESGRPSEKYKLYKFALTKYSDAQDATTEVPRYGATDINKARIKYGYSVGQHTTSGYGDKLDVAQYWWLRSAGGWQWRPNWCIMITQIGHISSEYNNGEEWSSAAWRNPLTRLSPLITLA